MPAKSEFKMGFWVGLGILLAFGIISMLQLAVFRASHVRKWHDG